MVRTYKKKNPAPQWTAEDVEAAINAVNTNEMSITKAAQRYGIPKTCLLRRIKSNSISSPRNDHFKNIFNKEHEDQIVKHILDLEATFYGLTPMDVRKLAYNVAEKMKIDHPFNKDKKIAGADWLYNFRKRNPVLALRAPEPTSIARAAGFNRIQVTKFFNLLSSLMEKHEFHPHQIYNADETGMNTVPNPRKIIAQKGRKQVGRIVSTERGFNVTVTCAISAAGSFVPPFVLFPRKRMSPLLMKGCPPGSVGYANGSGWMDTEHFVKYLEHFAKHTNASNDRKVLLILDNHSSHRNLDAIEKARSLNIVMISLPPHTSHRMQPLDCCFYGPLKCQYARECDKWLTNHPAQRITIYDVMEIFGRAFLHVSTLEKAVKGFAVTGIYPMNPDVFSDTDFLPSSVTDIPAEPDRNKENLQNQNKEESSQQNGAEPCREVEPLEPMPGPSSATNQPGPNIGSILSIVSPKPVCVARKTVSRRRAQTSEELTSTPFKNSLETEAHEKQRKLSVNKTKLVKKGKQLKRKCFPESSDESDGGISQKTSCSKRGKQVSAQRKISNDSTDSDEESNPECVYCVGNFLDSKSNEGWIRCQSCRKWAHELCAGATEEDDQFLCTYCDENVVRFPRKLRV